MEPNAAAELRKAYRITVLIGVAMLGTLIVYAVIVEFIKQQNAPFGGFNPLSNAIDALRYALLGVAGVVFFVIRTVNKTILSAKTTVVRNTSAAGPFGPDAQRLIYAAIVTFALCESVAIYGLILFVLQGNTLDFYLFLLLSLVYFGIYFPRYGTWEEWMQDKEKAARK